VVSKIQNSDQLVGGYNPLNWNEDHCRYKRTTESFIFNINNRNYVNTAQLSHIIGDYNRAVHCGSVDLPGFGGGRDFYFYSNNNHTVGYIGSNYVTNYNNINIVHGSK